MRGEKAHKFLAAVMAIVMILALIPTAAFAAHPTATATAETTPQTTQNELLKIVHVDCGRKYFSPDNLKKIMDNAAAAGFNAVELAFGNDGLRFLLEDMSVGTYTSEAVKAAVQQGNQTYNQNCAKTWSHRDYDTQSYGPYNPEINELTQAEMDDLIAYAEKIGLKVIPLLNTPGHMNTIVTAMQNLGIQTPNAEGKSSNTMNLLGENNEAVMNFTQDLVKKYITYFANHGCQYFNMGMDEYANDLPQDNKGFSFGRFGDDNQKWEKFVTYFNEIAAAIKDAGMTPIAFNDGLYYHNNHDYKKSWENGSEDRWNDKFDSDVMISYWSNGWSEYALASGDTFVKKGHKLINTNGSYYWVLGKLTDQCSPEKASEFNIHSFPSGYVNNPAGAMFCIWSDFPSSMTEEGVVTQTAETMKAFGSALPSSDSGDSPEPIVSPAPEVPETNDQHVELFVNGSATFTQNELKNPLTDSYSNSYVEVVLGAAQENPTHAESTYTRGAETDIRALQSGESKSVVIATGENMLTGDVQNAVLPELNAELTAENIWTITHQSDGRYQISRNSKYLRLDPQYGWNATLTLGAASNCSWNFTQPSTFEQSIYFYGNDYIHGIHCDGNTWQVVDVGDNNGPHASSLTLYEAVEHKPTDGITYHQNITFRGLKEGQTNIVIGDVTYHITVSKEELSQVEPLKVEHWITNVPVVPKDPHTADTRNYEEKNGTYQYMYSELSAAHVNRENGVEVRQLFTGKGTTDGHNMVLWQLRCLPSGSRQTADDGRDQSGNGNRMNYIRYWNNQWSYYDGSTWINIQNTDQIVAYYVQQTDTTKEVTTYVVDWGPTYADWNQNDIFWFQNVQYGASFCYLDFAVVYEGGDQSPTNFPVNNTLFFHAGDGTRTLGSCFFGESDQYEIWQVTTQDGKAVPSGTQAGQSTFQQNTFNPNYQGDETVVWTEHDGTKPHVDSLTMKNQCGKLVKIYVRAKRTTDQLIVHYVDRNNGKQVEFHTSRIAVSEGTVFDPQFGMNSQYTDINQALHNHSVTNTHNTCESVKADLTQISEIKHKYKTTPYKLTEVSRSQDGKEVTLYYNFSEPVHHFVADFGLPVQISRSDLGETTSRTVTAASHGTYGTTSVGTDGSVTYTPKQVLPCVDSFTVNMGDIEHVIYIHPASNVLYEENFFKTETGTPDRVDWNQNGAVSSRQSAQNQAAYGYDAAYQNSTGAHGVYTATVEADKNSPNRFTEKLKFNFNGTGFDLIGQCGPQTGSLTAMVMNLDTNQRVKTYMVDTSYSGQDLNQVPLIHADDLPDANYEIVVRGANIQHTKPAVMSMSTEVSNTISLDAYEVLNELGLTDEEICEVEFICMEDALPSAPVSRPMLMRAAPAEAGTDMTLTLDGFRVYRANANEQHFVEEEQNLIYTNVMNKTITGDFSAYVEGGTDGTYNVTTYGSSGGPENELYLNPGTGIVFQLDSATAQSAYAQVSLRAVRGATEYNNKQTISHNTEMYYKVDVENGMVTIANTGTDLLAIGNLKTNCKITAVQNKESAVRAVAMMFASPVEPEAFVPEHFDIQLSVERGYFAKYIHINAEASDDVAYITVDGQRVDANNADWVEFGFDPYLIFDADLEKGRNEKVEIEIVAYDLNGTASQTFLACK